jgi:hypothetical protein
LKPGDVDCDWCVRASGGGATIGGSCWLELL